MSQIRELTLRVATYNIHKGVQGVGPSRRLEIHGLAEAISAWDADFICLQEVRGRNHREARHFPDWPDMSQADFLAPQGYEAVYCTNAVTRHGDHGNALLSRWPVRRHWHVDISDHRFEQRGLLHAEVDVRGQPLHVIVAHFGLIPSSRVRQAERLCDHARERVPPQAQLLIAGDFNDWGTRVQQRLALSDLCSFEGRAVRTYPSRFPVTQLDHIYTRGLRPISCHAPNGRRWAQLSDHRPLLAEFGMRLRLAPNASDGPSYAPGKHMLA